MNSFCVLLAESHPLMVCLSDQLTWVVLVGSFTSKGPIPSSNHCVAKATPILVLLPEMKMMVEMIIMKIIITTVVMMMSLNFLIFRVEIKNSNSLTVLLKLVNKKAHNLAQCLEHNGCPINVGYESINTIDYSNISLIEQIY